MQNPLPCSGGEKYIDVPDRGIALEYHREPPSVYLVPDLKDLSRVETPRLPP